MLEVQFLKTVKDGQESVGTVSLNNGKITISGLSADLVQHLKNGIIGQYGKTYKISDGKKFLDNLRFEFKGAYFRATKTKNIKQIIIS